MTITQVGSFVGTNLVAGSGGGTFSANLPNGVQVGDLLWLCVEAHVGNSGYQANVSVPSGWTQFLSNSNGSSGSPGRGLLFYKYATAADVGVYTVNVTAASSQGSSSQVWATAAAVAFRGVTGIDSAYGSVGTPTTALATITTTKSTETLLCWALMESSTGANYNTTQQYPTGYTHLGTITASQYGVVAVASKPAATVGSYGGETWPSSSWNTAFSSFMVGMQGNNPPNAPTITTVAGVAPATTAAAAPTVDSASALAVNFTPSDPDGDACTGWDFLYRAAGTTGPFTTVHVTPGSNVANGTATTTTPLAANGYGGLLECRLLTYDTAPVAGTQSPSFYVNAQPAAVVAATGGQGGTSVSAQSLLALTQAERALRAAGLV